MFRVIARECYSGAATEEMRQTFLRLDNRGYANKVDVLTALFDEFPPKFRIPPEEIYPFWKARFPECFSPNAEILALAEKISRRVKTAIITNGLTEVQKAKIRKTGLDKIFDTVIISEEMGVKKPDTQIFNIALERIGVRADESMFVGDHLHNDVGGSQSAGMKGIWFNPEGRVNDTDITPFLEIGNLAEILPLLG
jgi:putative hydrolase of the HAD superfamily